MRISHHLVFCCESRATVKKEQKEKKLSKILTLQHAAYWHLFDGAFILSLHFNLKGK